jgi:nucleotide-binding universal stress UspA family protein
MKIAQTFNARISLLHVRENYSHEVIEPQAMSQELGLNSEYDIKVTEKLDEWRNEALARGVSRVDIVLGSGRIAQEVRNYVKEENADLVVMGTHGTHGVEEFFLGSNAYRVISTVKCPVLTVRSESAVIGYKNVVVPMDDTPSSRNKLMFCADWAKTFDAQLKLLCLCEQADQQRMQHLEAVCEQVSKALQAEDVKFSINHVEADNNAEEAVRYAEYGDADLLIIMSETETTIGGMLIGTYAQQVVNHSKVPVLTIHPEDRDTPLDIFS